MGIHLKVSIIIILIIIGTSPLLAQKSSNLSGQIKEESGVVLPYANISLIEENTENLITGVVSDEKGKFSLSTQESGHFRLRVSSIGYQTLMLEVFELKPGESKDFGNLIMQEEVESLDEVIVQSTKPNIYIEADRIIVNIEGTVMAEGNTALDVIGKSPGVYVDANENINLNGRSGVIVMIDDRRTYMSNAELAGFLRGMPAENIKSLEIINNPPARYDAEGAAGIINIKLKKNKLDGIHGDINIGHQYNGVNTPFAGASLNLKKAKWTMNTNLNYRESARIIDVDIFRRFQLDNGLTTFDQTERLYLLSNNLFFSGGADYQINDKHSVGVNLQGSKSRGHNEGDAFANIYNPGSTDVNFFRSLNDGNSDHKRLFANLHYIWEIDTLGSMLTTDLDMARVDGDRNSLLNTTYWLNEQGNNQYSDRIRTRNGMDYTIFTSKVDFTKPLGKERIFETGLKGSWVKSDSDLNISRSVGEEDFLQDSNSNQFVYNENVLAAYATYKAPINDRIDFQAGLRAEYSEITGNSINSNQINKQQYMDLFPSVFIEHKLSENYRIIYNANRRITRPNYSLLNPFVQFIGVYTTEEGNPQLRPQYVNNFEISNVFKDAYQLTFSYSQTTNAFQQIMTQNEQTLESRLQIQNVDKAENLSMRLMAPVELTKWWNTNNMLQLYYNRFKIQIGEELFDQGQFSYMMRTQHNFLLPKGFRLELFGMYISPYQQGQMRIVQGFAWADAGISKTFLDEKLTITANGTDIFRTHKVKHNINFANINTDLNQYNNLQSIRLTARYRFSSGKSFRMSNRSGSTEEKQRLD